MLKEQIREFWERNPCNARHSNEPKDSGAYFIQVALKRYTAEPHIFPFADFPKWEGKKVLDAGCGIGTDALQFAAWGAHVIGIDGSTAALDIAWKGAKTLGLQSYASFHKADLEKRIMVGPVEFDLIYSFGVLHHLPNPALALRGFTRRMHYGSELRAMVYSQVSYKAFHSLRQSGHHNMGRLKSAYQYRSEAAEGCPLTHQYTLAEARALFEGAGLHIIDMRKAHIFVWDVEEYKQGNFVKSREWEGVSDERIKSLEPELGQHILIRARRDMNR